MMQTNFVFQFVDSVFFQNDRIVRTSCVFVRRGEVSNGVQRRGMIRSPIDLTVFEYFINERNCLIKSTILPVELRPDCSSARAWWDDRCPDSPCSVRALFRTAAKPPSRGRHRTGRPYCHMAQSVSG